MRDVLAAVGNQLWRVRGDALELLSTNKARFGLTRLVPHNDTLYVHGPGRLTPYAFGAFGGVDCHRNIMMPLRVTAIE